MSSLPPDFESVFRISYESVPVELVKHKPTGMYVCLAKVKSPCVNGYFSVHTESFDHYGLPHTLEHLVFMGSEAYPYKGVLDLLANQCLAQGTNAWTDTDNTTYTVETAGSEGFLNILPVYIDHLLYPTLTDAAFLTEIHHIDGEGTDSGVVYCEMQARENEREDIMEFQKRQLMFHDKNKSMKSETGGRLLELRDITNKQIQDYHKSYYQPDNICVVVCGQVEMKDLCERLVPVLDKYPVKTLVPLKRPFSTPIEPLSQSHYKELPFPSEDEENGGAIHIAWFGPDWEDFDATLACECLLGYLSQDSISPLRMKFCDVPEGEPLCSDVSFGKMETHKVVFTLELDCVDSSQLPIYSNGTNIDEVVLDVIKAAGKDLDLTRMKSLIELGKRKHLQRLESSPHDAFCDFILSEFLFGPTFADRGAAAGSGGGGSGGTKKGLLKAEKTGKTMLSNMKKVERFDELMKYSKEKWENLLNKYFIDNKRVTIVGQPSKAAADKLQNDETARLEEQRKKLGERGLEEKATSLEKAEEENSVETPEKVLKSIGLPDLRKINLIPCKTQYTKTGARHGMDICKQIEVESDSDEAMVDSTPTSETNPLLCDCAKIQFDSVEGAQFCDIRYVFKLDDLSPELKKVLPIWRGLAFESPLKASKLGPALTKDDVVNKCTDIFNYKICRVSDGQGSASQWGMGGLATNALIFYVKVQKSQFVEGAEFLMRLKEDVEFTEEKVKIAASRLLNEAPEEKRNGEALCKFATRALCYDDDSIQKVFSWPLLVSEYKILGSGKEEDEDDEEEDDEEKSEKKELTEPSSTVNEAEKKEKLQEVIKNLEALQKNLAVMAIHCGGEFSQAEQDIFLNVKTDNLSDDNKGPLFQKCSTPYKPLKKWNQLTKTAENMVIHRPKEERKSSKASSLTRGILLPCASIESNYFRIMIPTEIRSFQHPDLAAVLLAQESFSMLEGPFWRKIRGKGLSYSYTLQLSFECGCYIFSLSKSTNPVAAYKEARNIILSEYKEFLRQEVNLNAARSGIAFEIFSGISTIPGILYSSFVDTLAQRPKNRVEVLLKRLMECTPDQVVAACEKHILPLFGAVGSNAFAEGGSLPGRIFSISTPENKKEEVKKAIAEAVECKGWKVLEKSVKDIENQYASPDGYSRIREEMEKC